jgi:hypothetical protein
VKSKILLISLVVVLALSIGLIGCEGEGEVPTEIMIGTCRDTNEDMFIFECYHGGPAMRWWVNKINDEDGGIVLSDYGTDPVELELVVREFNLGGWDIGTVVLGLIDDGADVIFGGPSTDTVYTLAPICNANSVILMSFEGGASKMVWEHESYLDQWPYVWVNLSFANWYEIPVLKGIMDEAVTGDPVAYVTYIGGPGAEHGLEYTQTTIDEFGVSNILPTGTSGPEGVGLEHPFIMTQGEADTLILGAMAALNVSGNNDDYDIFCAYTYPWNVTALFASIQTYDFNPPAIIFGPGSSQGYFEVNNGADVIEGIMSFGTSNMATTVAVGTPTMTMAEMYGEIGAQIEQDWTTYAPPCGNIFGASNGTELLDFWGLPIFAAGMEMWRSAVEEAGNLDNTAIRNVMAAYSSSNPVSTVFGDTWYHVFGEDPVTGAPNLAGGGIVDYICQTGQIGQWQSGIFEILGFTGITTDDWAVPPWTDNVSLATPLPNYCITANYTANGDSWYWLSH